jgi:DNA repair protein RadC
MDLVGPNSPTIELLDHLVIGQVRWVSLRRLGLGFGKA